VTLTEDNLIQLGLLSFRQLLISFDLNQRVLSLRYGLIKPSSGLLTQAAVTFATLATSSAFSQHVLKIPACGLT
jgi:hypothetical protein